MLIGGGQDREQRRIAADLQGKGEALRAAAAESGDLLDALTPAQAAFVKSTDHFSGASSTMPAQRGAAGVSARTTSLRT